LLDMQTNNLSEIWNTLVDDWVRMNLVPASYHEPLVATLLQPYRHQHQFQGSLIKKNKSTDLLNGTAASKKKLHESLNRMPSVNSMSSVETLKDDLNGAAEKVTVLDSLILTFLKHNTSNY
jgi:hypothetical protein